MSVWILPILIKLIIHKTWMNWDNLIPFEDLWSLDTPALIQTRCGVQEESVPSQMAFLYFGPKQVHVITSCQAPDKKFPIFYTGLLEIER